MAATSLNDESTHLHPGTTTALDDDSAEAIFSDITLGKDPELHHTTVSISQLSDCRGNESHPGKLARIEACKGIEKQAKKGLNAVLAPSVHFVSVIALLCLYPSLIEAR